MSLPDGGSLGHGVCLSILSCPYVLSALFSSSERNREPRIQLPTCSGIFRFNEAPQNAMQFADVIEMHSILIDTFVREKTARPF
jgi:hypothetical protein